MADEEMDEGIGPLFREIDVLSDENLGDEAPAEEPEETEEPELDEEPEPEDEDDAEAEEEPAEPEAEAGSEEEDEEPAPARDDAEDRYEALQRQIAQQEAEIKRLRDKEKEELDDQKALIEIRQEVRRRVKDGEYPKMSPEEQEELAQQAFIVHKENKLKQIDQPPSEEELLRREARVRQVERMYEDAAEATGVDFDVKKMVRFIETQGKKDYPEFRKAIEKFGTRALDNPEAFLYAFDRFRSSQVSPAVKAKKAEAKASKVKPLRSAGGSRVKTTDRAGVVDGIPIEDEVYELWRDLYHDLSMEYGQTGEANPHPDFVKRFRRSQENKTARSRG